MIKILAIDDNPDNLITIIALINEAFPEAIVLTAQSGPKGLELATAEDPDVILLDIVMPVMDGFEVCEILKSDEKLKNIPVVFVTAIKGDKESRVRALECGAEAFLAKPIDEYELTAQIRAMVKIKAANIEKITEKERLAKLVLEKTHELQVAHQATLNLFEDLRKENEARSKSEEKYRLLIDLAPDAFFQGDEVGNLIEVNDFSAKLTGYNRGELLEMNMKDLFSRESIESNPLMYNLLEKGETIKTERELIRKDGQPIWVSMNSKKMPNGTYQSFIRDITVRKDSELLLKAMNEELIQTNEELITEKEHAEESDRLKSAFLANMSHEIRTPMNGILGFAGLLREPGLSGEEQQEYIRIIEKSGKRMLNIINDIVDISKIESGQMEVLLQDSIINDQIEYVYTFFKPEVEKKGMQLYFNNSLPSKESIIKTDREKVYAILTNLVKNAIKYSETGYIELGYNFVGAQNMGAQNIAPLLQFYVKDTGIGIPKDRQAAIFDRFVQADIADTRAYQGAGLGLSISKAYVEMLGGKIGVESEEGKGSCFYFTLPYNNESAEKTAHRNLKLDDRVENKVKSLKILIVEDDEVSTVLISMIVSKICKEVTKVRNGVEAVEVCRNRPDIDLILMDIKLPEMDGYEATRQIRQFNQKMIIIAQTAHGLSGDREKSIEAGCNDYLSKPTSKEDLLNMISKYS